MIVRYLYGGILGLLLFLPSLSSAQQVSMTCEQTLRQVEIDRSILELHMRQLRQTMATELRQTLERAEKAEQALAKLNADTPQKQADAVKQEK
jgi:hypothetical protein